MLFGGNKGYNWMSSFLGLMSTITLRRKDTEKSDPALINMIYLIKLLTILTNILVSNLILIRPQKARAYVLSVVQFVESGKNFDSSLIPSCNDGSSD